MNQDSHSTTQRKSLRDMLSIRGSLLHDKEKEAQIRKIILQNEHDNLNREILNRRAPDIYPKKVTQTFSTKIPTPKEYSRIKSQNIRTISQRITQNDKDISIPAINIQKNYTMIGSPDPEPSIHSNETLLPFPKKGTTLSSINTLKPNRIISKQKTKIAFAPINLKHVQNCENIEDLSPIEKRRISRPSDFHKDKCFEILGDLNKGGESAREGFFSNEFSMDEKFKISNPSHIKEKYDDASKSQLKDIDLDHREEMIRIIQDQRDHKLKIPETGKMRIRDVQSFHHFIILPDDPLKKRWDFIVTILLLFTAVVTPYRICFIDIETTEWIVIDSLVDAIFSFDIVLNFFSAFYDNEENLVTQRKAIATHYLKTWCSVDFMAVLPVNWILASSKDYNSLARLARLPRLYRLLKITKLARVFKIAKERSKVLSYLNDLLKLKAGLERLFYFGLIIFIICHITACLWYFMAKMDDFGPSTWIVRYDLRSKDNYDIYIASLFWALTLVTTIGDSAIKAETSNERIMSIILMCVGVCSYSFLLGSLTSVLTSLDAKEAKLKEKLRTLEELRIEYQINYNTYIKLRKAVKYDHNKNESDKFQFMSQLPKSLNLELSVIIHQEMINKIPFFQKQTPYFISYLGPLLKYAQIEENEYIYAEGDPIEGMYFLVKGKASFVVQINNQDTPFINIEEGDNFGELDLVDCDTDSKRKFTVKTIEKCEVLVISIQDLMNIDLEFPQALEPLVQDSQKRLKRCLYYKSQAIHQILLKTHGM